MLKIVHIFALILILLSGTPANSDLGFNTPIKPKVCIENSTTVRVKRVRSQLSRTPHPSPLLTIQFPRFLIRKRKTRTEKGILALRMLQIIRFCRVFVRSPGYSQLFNRAIVSSGGDPSLNMPPKGKSKV